jgi:hypothetical protein
MTSASGPFWFHLSFGLSGILDQRLNEIPWRRKRRFLAHFQISAHTESIPSVA